MVLYKISRTAKDSCNRSQIVELYNFIIVVDVIVVETKDGNS